MRKLIYYGLLLIFVFGIVFALTSESYAYPSQNASDYVLRDNATNDRFGTNIALNDALTSHGWFAEQGSDTSTYASSNAFGVAMNIPITAAVDRRVTTSIANHNTTFTINFMWTRDNTGALFYGAFKIAEGNVASNTDMILDWQPVTTGFRWSDGHSGRTLDCNNVVFYTTSLAAGQVYNVTIIANTTGFRTKINSSSIQDCNIGGGTVDWKNLSFFTTDNGGGGTANLQVEHLRIWNGTVEPQMSTATPSSSPNLSVSANDYFDNVALQNLTMVLLNENFRYNYTTQNGSIVVNNVTNGIYNITISALDNGGYMQRQYYNFNISGNSLNAKLWQSVIYVNATTTAGTVAVQNFGIRVNGSQIINLSNSTGYATLRLKKGVYTITANATPYINSSTNLTSRPYDENFMSMNFYSSFLRIDAKEVITGNYISSFTIDVNGSNSFSSSSSTTNGNVTLNIDNGTYNLYFSSPSQAISNATISIIVGNYYPNYTFSVYTMNSINFSIYDEEAGKPNKIVQNVTIEMVSSISATNYSTTNGSIYLDLIAPSDYRISYSSPGYTKREYYFTLTNTTHNEIDLYLLLTASGTSVTYTIQDQSGNLLEGALVKLLRYYSYSNSYVNVAMAKTDLSGIAVINTDFNDPFYQVEASRNGTSFLTQGQKIYATTATITLQLLPDTYADWITQTQTNTNLSFNNNTQTFSYTFSNGLGTNVIGNLKVSHISSSGENILCENSGTSSASTLLCPVNTTLIDGTIVAIGSIDSMSGLGASTTDSLQVTRGAITYLKTLSESSAGTNILLAVIFAGTMAGLGFFSPSSAIVFFLIGLGSMIFMGFSAITLVLYGGVVIGGLFIVYKLRS